MILVRTCSTEFMCKSVTTSSIYKSLKNPSNSRKLKNVPRGFIVFPIEHYLFFLFSCFLLRFATLFLSLYCLLSLFKLINIVNYLYMFIACTVRIVLYSFLLFSVLFALYVVFSSAVS